MTPQKCELAGTRIWAKDKEQSYFDGRLKPTYLSYLDQQDRCYVLVMAQGDNQAWYKRVDILYDGASGKELAWAAIDRSDKKWGQIDSRSGTVSAGDDAHEKAMAFIHSGRTQKAGTGRYITP